MHLSINNYFKRYRDGINKVAALYNQKSEVRIFFQLFLLLVTSSIFLVFAIKPTSITIIGLFKEIKGKQATIKAMDEKMTDIHEAQQVYTQQKELIDLLDLALPDEPQPELFIGQLDSVSRQNAITIDNADFSKVIIRQEDKNNNTENTFGDLPPKTYGFNVAFSGAADFSATKTYLSNLENLLRPLKIDSVDITRTPDNNLIITIKAKVPYYKS